MMTSCYLLIAAPDRCDPIRADKETSEASDDENFNSNKPEEMSPSTAELTANTGY